MKRTFAYMFKRFNRFAVATLAALSVVLVPLQAVKAAQFELESALGVMNVTAGETDYKLSTNAKYDDEVQFEVYYHNREAADSGHVINNVRVKVDLPTQAGKTQVVKATVNGDNSNTVVNTTTVNLDRSDAMLEFVPGSVHWKHNKGTNDNKQIVSEVIADSIILEGKPLENEQPCWNFEATVSFQMRVRVPSVSIDKKVRLADQGKAVKELTVKPEDKVEYLISFKNLGNTNLSNVVIRDAMPKGVTFVPGSVKLFNGANPNGATIDNDYLFHGGVNAGSFAPGSNGYITYQAIVDKADALQCGMNTLKNIAVIDTDQTGEYNNTANINVEKKCEEPQKSTATCKLLTIKKIDEANRKITASVEKSVSGDVKVKNYVFDFGDGTEPVTTTDAVREHAYATDGPFTVKVAINFTVDGKDANNVSSDACAATVDFKKQVVVPPTLPNTGAGSVAGLFAGVSAAGAAAHSVIRRKLARR